MLLYDLKRDGEAESGTFSHVFGGKKRIKNMRHDMSGNTFASIFDFDPHLIIFSTTAERDSALLLNGLSRIDQQIQKDLINL